MILFIVMFNVVERLGSIQLLVVLMILQLKIAFHSLAPFFLNINKLLFPFYDFFSTQWYYNAHSGAF